VQVRDVMTTEVITIDKESTVADAVKIMIDNRVSGLPVVDEQGKLYSMITKSDIVQYYLPSILRDTPGIEEYTVPPVNDYLNNLYKLSRQKVGDIVSKVDVVCVTPEMTVSQLAVKLFASEMRRLPVVGESGEIKGIVSNTNILSLIWEN